MAKKSTEACLVSSAGASGYGVLEGILGSSPERIFGNASFFGFCLFAYSLMKRSIKSHQDKEQHDLENNPGSVKAPDFLAWRPIFYAFAPVDIAISITSFLGYWAVPEKLPTLPQESFDRLEGLQYIFNSIQIISSLSYNYFLEQIPTPPTKKKSVLKTLYEKAKGKLQAAPVPQLERTEYRSIDDVVA